MEMLCFRLPGHGDTTLKEMNLLRSRQHFCDVTIVASDKQTFKGHKVVLAACSPFLRDQFLLNPSSKLQVSMLHSSVVVCDLLQSCYTGLLQFSPEEIVNYLTAASYLQMEHIVERCRGALKKYMQPRHPTPPGFKTEETHGTPVIVSGSAHSVNSMSPPVGRSSPVQQHNHIELLSYENNTDMHPQSNNNHHNDAPLLDEACIKVSVSEDEETRHDDDVFEVYLPDEEQSGGDGREDTAVAPDGPPDACNSAGAFVACREDGSNPAEGELSASGFVREGLAFKRRLPEPKGGRGRGRGRGLKKRKWVSPPQERQRVSPPQERQPAVAVAQQQDLWYLATAEMSSGSGFGLDYGGAEALKPGGYLALDLPRGDFGVGEAQGAEGDPAAGGVDDGMAHYALEDSSGGPGEGGSGLAGGVRPDESGDESVAVVGSTSNAMGPVICENCGMTFPSAHSLAVHARSNHLLYVCPCCGKHFHQAANLTRHMAIHWGAGKSHQCPLCYKTFTQKSTLIDHMNLHSGERPHHCAYCHARFAHKPALRRHLKEQHGKTTGQNSLHEQEEREREKSVREEAQEHLVSEQT